MAECPKCRTENKKHAKEWVGGVKTSRPMSVQRFVCSACGTSYVSWKDSKTGEVRSMTRR